MIEDDSLHKSVSSIDIKATNDTDKEDANGVPLYKTSIPLVVSVSDTHSGISKLNGLFLMIIRTALFQLILTVNILAILLIL